VLNRRGVECKGSMATFRGTQSIHPSRRRRSSPHLAHRLSLTLTLTHSLALLPCAMAAAAAAAPQLNLLPIALSRNRSTIAVPTTVTPCDPEESSAVWTRVVQTCTFYNPLPLIVLALDLDLFILTLQGIYAGSDLLPTCDLGVDGVPTALALGQRRLGRLLGVQRSLLFADLFLDLDRLLGRLWDLARTPRYVSRDDNGVEYQPMELEGVSICRFYATGLTLTNPTCSRKCGPHCSPSLHIYRPTKHGRHR
jgi:hypothetical protein